MKVKVKRAQCLQGIYNQRKARKRGKTQTPPLGDTGITGVVTRQLTGGKISSPSQPYCVSVITCPQQAAAWSGVHPSASLSLGDILCSSNSSPIDMYPLAAATCSYRENTRSSVLVTL